MITKWNDVINNYDVEELKSKVTELYLNKNFTQKQLSEELNINGRLLITHFNLKKSKDMQTQAVKNNWKNKSDSDKEEIKEKIKQTNLKKYGVENPFQNKELMKKAYEEKLGVDHPWKSNEVKEKIKQTNLERYGVENVAQSNEIKEKIKQTCLINYGTICPLSNNEIKDKIRQTNLKNYGVEYTWQREDVKEKSKQTKKERYGNENYFNIEKYHNTNLKKYKVIHPMKLDEIKEKLKNTMNKRYGHSYALQVPSILNKQRTTMKRLYGVYSMFEKHIYKSKMELEIYNKISSIYSNSISGYKTKDNFEIDIYIPEIKTGIECNGNYWHSSLYKDKNYHINKTNKCKENNIRLIHIWEYEYSNLFLDKIINILSPKQKLYARKCEIREVSKQECNDFLNNYHLQNSCRGQKVRYGLYYKNKLIQIMTFGEPRYNKNYQWELLRLCSHKDYIIIGGSKRLWMHFLKENNPSNVISYCDNSKFSGDVYKKIGMKLENIGKPNIVWAHKNNFIRNSLLLQLGADKLLNTNYGKNISNEDIMIQNNWLKVYDCGQSIFTYENYK